MKKRLQASPELLQSDPFGRLFGGGVLKIVDLNQFGGLSFVVVVVLGFKKGLDHDYLCSRYTKIRFL